MTLLDDHSRYAIAVAACTREDTPTVQQYLTQTFRQWGLHERMLMDHGAPWGNCIEAPHTRLSVWLMRLGIRVVHSGAFHPQTQGKIERFHCTLLAEAITGRHFNTLDDAQHSFDYFRQSYNHERPHEALEMHVPASRYTISPHAYPEPLPPIEYGPDDLVRNVQHGGYFSLLGHECKTSKAFSGYPIAARPTRRDGVYNLYFCTTRIQQIDLNQL